MTSFEPKLLNQPNPVLSQEYFCKKIKIFNDKQSQTINDFFSKQSETSYFDDGFFRRGLTKVQPFDKQNQNQNNTWFEVTFDEQGKIKEGELTIQYSSYSNYQEFKNVTKIAIESMAQSLGWKNETHLMGISLAQHQIKAHAETTKIPFHIDGSHYTMVLMLDDEKSWNGGDFQYRLTSQKEMPKYPAHTEKPQKGYGILFSNKGCQHSVTKMVAKDQATTRTIMTIHERKRVSETEVPKSLCSRIFSRLSDLTFPLHILKKITWAFYQLLKIGK